VTLPKAATELLQATAADAVAAASVRDSTDLTSTAPSVYNGTGSNATDSNDALWSKYVVRSGYVLPVDPLFVAKINPFWLRFDPPSAGEHYGLAVFYFLMMLFGVIGNALVVFMFYRTIGWSSKVTSRVHWMSMMAVMSVMSVMLVICLMIRKMMGMVATVSMMMMMSMPTVLPPKCTMLVLSVPSTASTVPHLTTLANRQPGQLVRYLVTAMLLLQQLRLLASGQRDRPVDATQLLRLLLEQAALYRSRGQAHHKPVYQQWLQQARIKLALHRQGLESGVPLLHTFTTLLLCAIEQGPMAKDRNLWNVLAGQHSAQLLVRHVLRCGRVAQTSQRPLTR
uniref:G-protein coupled receptors family 1 profile domain-containing protein n=1 Tax=Anopheles melas TaxID=34690 RepID=A0A182UL45_9DIPT